MKYCSKCLMPDTRPGITFVDGVCSPCINFAKHKTTNWDARMHELKTLCDKHRKINGTYYDCVIAVSGGKDSHFQVYYMKEVMKMNPLLLSVGNIDWTETGKKNLDNLSETFGCDMMVFQPNRQVAKKMFRKAFEKIGSPTWYMDSLMYAYPVKMAQKLGISLVVYGEDVNYTYGGKYNEETPSALFQPKNDVAKPVWKEWFEEGDVTEEELQITIPLSIEECRASLMEPIYLSYFVPWNSFHNYDVAKKWGFRHLGHEYEREGFIENFDQIDTLGYLLNIHLKYLKFGHAYATDIASRMIRYGLKTREEMIPIVKKHDPELDQGIVDKFCEFTNYTPREFWKIIDKWYNPDLFYKGNDGIFYPKFEVGVGLKN